VIERRVLIVGAILLVLGIVILGARWLPGPTAPIPTATASLAVSLTPSLIAVPRPGLPDPRHTPGAINPAVTQDNIAATICKRGWAATVRPPAAYTAALKVAQILEYGYADRDPRHYQEDHLVPLELGGAPRDPRNLWPEPNVIELPDGTRIESKKKDDLEDALHGRVCSAGMALGDAQRLIAGDWIAAWEAAGRP
jgi:hypothetical protein